MIFRRLVLPLMGAIICAIAGNEVLAQSAPAAQLPAQAAQDDASGFPPVSNPPTTNLGTSPPISPECMKEFAPLRDEAEKRGRLIKSAAERHAGPLEACKLIRSYGQAESEMISFVETHASACAILTGIRDQLKGGHKKTEALQTRVCNVAQQMQQKHSPAGPVGDFDWGGDVTVNKRPPRGPVGDFLQVR